MFTGIIATTSKITSTEKLSEIVKITIDLPSNWSDVSLGDSISVDGVCLTIAEINENSFSCMVVEETLSVSTFGISFPDFVNLERAVKVGDRLDGHIVQGHVDQLGEILTVSNDENKILRIKFGALNRSLIVYKGSICVNGVALTISKILDGWFEVSLVPYTLEHTTLGTLESGDHVNLEFDILGKYVVNAIKNWEQDAKS